MPRPQVDRPRAGDVDRRSDADLGGDGSVNRSAKCREAGGSADSPIARALLRFHTC